MEQTQSYTNTSTKRAWIAEQARAHPERVFNSLHHLIDEDWMREAYRRTRKDGASGIDGVKAADYERDLEANLKSLLERIKAGRYHAPPVRRQYIPKADGRLRPLGIPTLEDKVAQRAIVMLLEPIYESDFLSCSYGFRPGRSAHDALDTVYESIGRQGQTWVIDADVAGYLQLSSYCHPTDADRPNGPRYLHNSFLFSYLRNDSRNRPTAAAADLTHCNSPLRCMSAP